MRRVTETHPMAEILGTVQDLEDYKQKIVKQKQLKKRTINAVKKYLSNDETKFLEAKIIEENVESLSAVEKAFKSRLNGVYKNNAEKYEYLIQNEPQNEWIQEFKQTKEYKLLYE